MKRTSTQRATSPDESWRAQWSADSLAHVAFRMASRWCHSREDAEDTAQEAMLRFLDSGQSVRRLEPWFYVVTRRIAGRLYSRRIDEERGQRRLQRSAKPTTPAYDAILSANETFSRLATHDRRILELAVLGLSYAEISTTLGCPANQVGRRLARARQRASRLARSA